MKKSGNSDDRSIPAAKDTRIDLNVKIDAPAEVVHPGGDRRKASRVHRSRLAEIFRLLRSEFGGFPR